jgi:large subunit ribosomal protein L19
MHGAAGGKSAEFKRELLMNVIQQVEQEEMKRLSTKQIDEFRPGDTVKIHCRVVEGNKTRIQIFEGTVLYSKGSGLNANLCVRKIAVGAIGVERVFPIYSPTVVRIECVRQGRVRRARLYYLRDRVGKRARIREKSALSARMVRAREDARAAKAQERAKKAAKASAKT